MAPDLHATDFVFPVMGLDVGSEGQAGKPREACGTAFAIGGGMYMTAAHVWKSASRFPLQALGLDRTGGPTPEGMLLRKVYDYELFDPIDLAILKIDVSFGPTFAWSATLAALLDPVRAFGYLYAFDAESEILTVRAFQGEIVGGGPLQRLPGRPGGYELSFPCPRGLSGSPLIRHVPNDQIVGVVLGNEITEMTVFSETETLAEGGVEKQLIKTEAMHLGVAIRASEILPLRSSLLAGTIGEWLQRHGIPVTM